MEQSGADMRKALELQAEQPHVLNYLGYSWIDQGINLDEGMKISAGVEQRPDMVTSWIRSAGPYYRIGNYEDAVKHLERAIDLKPEDPTSMTIRRRLLAHRPHPGSKIPVGSCPRPETRAGRVTQDRSQARNGAGGHFLRRFRGQEKEDGKGG